MIEYNGNHGWLKLYRAIIDKPIWKNSTPEHKVVLISILCLANHKEAEWEWMGKKFKVLPGQIICSLDSLAKSSGKGITTKSVRNALLRFEKLGFLANQSTKTGRLITICNWDNYQNSEETKGKAAGKERANIGQRTNKVQATNKNENQIKNVTNERNSLFSDCEGLTAPASKSKFNKPTIDEVKEYCEQRGNSINPQQWFDYYTANGWKVGRNQMKDWKATIRTWETNHINKNLPQNFKNSVYENQFNRNIQENFNSKQYTGTL